MDLPARLGYWKKTHCDKTAPRNCIWKWIDLKKPNSFLWRHSGRAFVENGNIWWLKIRVLRMWDNVKTPFSCRVQVSRKMRSNLRKGGLSRVLLHSQTLAACHSLKQTFCAVVGVGTPDFSRGQSMQERGNVLDTTEVTKILLRLKSTKYICTELQADLHGGMMSRWMRRSRHMVDSLKKGLKTFLDGKSFPHWFYPMIFFICCLLICCLFTLACAVHDLSLNDSLK